MFNFFFAGITRANRSGSQYFEPVSKHYDGEKAYEKLLKELNRQLAKHQIIIKTGFIVDASVVDTSLKPKGKISYEVAQDRKEDERGGEELEKEEAERTILKTIKSCVDNNGAWIKKSGKLRGL